MPNKTQTNTKKKSSKLAKVVIALLIVLILLVGALGAFFAIGGFDGLPPIGAAAKPYMAEGDVSALTLAPTGGGADEASLRAYYASAVSFAATNGINTLIYEGKSDLSVYWRDNTFPAASAIAAQDTFFYKLDPLAILCEEAEGSGVQIWVSVDPYSAAGYDSEMKGKAASLAAEQGVIGARFDPANEEYRDLLTKSLGRLPHKYPIAGIVFTGFDSGDAADTQSWNTGFGSMVSQLRATWSEKAYPTKLSLQFDGEGGTWLSTELITSLGTAGGADYLLPEMQAGSRLLDHLTAWDAAGNLLAVYTDSDTTGTVFFTSTNSVATSGALLGGYADALAQPAQFGLLKSMLTPAPTALPVGYEVPNTFQLTYPALSSGGVRATTFANVYLMGTSDPQQPLLLNGVEIGSAQSDGSTFGVRGEKGAFGVLVPLEMGENTFTFTNGQTYTEIIRRDEVPTSSGGTPDTRPIPEAGQAMRIVTENELASALTNPSDPASINETFYAGAVFVVTEATRGSYRLASGDWVYAENCEWISGDGASAFTGLVAEAHEEGETIHFTGSGTPAAYLHYEGGTLYITMYNTTFTLPEGFSSTYVRSASVKTNEDGSTVLALQLNEIWGYSIEYVDGATQLFLKEMPQLSANPERLLEGVHVMVDPGHGSMDAANVGSGGILWYTGEPHEKDINLTLAEAIAYRLEQMGATVTLTRTEDVNVTNGERIRMQRELKPDFFLSIHHDAAELNADRSGATHMQTFYFHPYSVPPSKDYAQNLMDAVRNATGREGNDADWGYYLVTRVTNCPSILFEYGFLINPLAFEDVVSTEGIYAAAVGTANGILASMPQSTAPAQPAQTGGGATLRRARRPRRILPPPAIACPSRRPSRHAACAFCRCASCRLPCAAEKPMSLWQDIMKEGNKRPFA